MIQYNKVFYKCLGFQTNIKYNKPLFFYHVPKCAGTTFTVLISHLISKNYRINGTLFNNNDKGGPIAYENYIEEPVDCQPKPTKKMNSSEIELTVDLDGFQLANPIMAASGTFGYGLEFADFVDLNRLGGHSPSSTPLSAQLGPPRGSRPL